MIQSVDRALRILMALQDERLLGVSDLANRLGLAKGTVHGLLQTLAARSMVEQDPASGKYMLGPALLVMGNVYLNSHDLRVRSLHWVTSLADTTGLAVRLAVLVWPDVVIVHHVAASDATIPVSEVGLGMPAHATALGKAILAFHPDRVRLLGDEPLSRLTGSTITDPAELLAGLKSVAEAGSAVESQEAVVGETEVAGAIFDRGGSVIGAVSAVLPSTDPPPESVVAGVRETARAISRELGAPTWPIPA
ncbi:MAG TPA: IclR family transcriptional regulator [Acidimicrobiia bacterium]|nr:IclR family transcriptional regulator [Acidimicrobiia bacterium]